MKKVITLLVFAFVGSTSYSQLAWLQMPDFPGTGKLGVSSFSINNKGYMGLGVTDAGGKSTDWYEYDPGANTWTQKASIPVGRSSCVSFVIGSKGYIATGELAGSRTAEVWEYDPAANTWTQKAPVPGSARMNAAGFSINGKGYVGTGFIGGQVTSDFYEYDPIANTWTSKASVPGSTRNGAAGFSADNKGYIGMGCAWNATAYYNDFYEYDPIGNTWSQKANFPQPSIGNAVSYSATTAGYVLSGYVYQYSGITHNPMNTIYKYVPASDTWTWEGTFPCLPRGYAGGFSLSNDIYIGAGGQSNTINDLVTDFWKLSNGLTLLVEPGNPDTGFRMYPNPAADVLFIESEIAGEVVENVRVYDTQGKLLLSKPLDRTSSSLDVSALSAGIYFIEAITNNGKVLDGKFIR